jgi:hypothetical protein
MGSDSRARRGLRALAITTVSSLLIVGAYTGAAGAASPTNTQRGQQGAQWLANQIKANGGVLQSFGKPDPVDTAYAVIGLRANGVDKPASDQAIAALKTRIDTDLETGGHASPGAIAQYVLAALADGQDPRHFGGTGAQNNLVNRLLATARTTGVDKGLFGAAEPTFDGAFRQGLALAALEAAGVSAHDARVSAGIAWLTKQQCANGLWESYRARPAAVPCVPANPETFTGPDTNSTSMAVQGLAAWGKFPKQNTVLGSLRKSQSSDAGFPFVAAKNQPSDPNSTALVIQALLAEKSAPSAATWKKGTKTPYTALAGYQLSCASPDFGAFDFPGSTAANVFATVQSVPAMAGKKLPVASSAASVVLGLTPC